MNDRRDLSSPEVIRHLQRRAKSAAVNAGYPELADDFSQEVFVTWLSGQGQHQTLDQAFIDYLRKHHGDTRSGGGRLRFEERCNGVPLDEIRNLAAESGHREPDRGFDHLFGGRDAIVYHLYFVEEMSESAIGDVLGVTVSRISQLLGDIKRRIKVDVMLSDARERMEWDEDFGVFKVNWISI